MVPGLPWNYPKRDVPKGTRLWKFGMDRVYGPFYRTFMANPDVLKRVLDKLLSLDFTSILPAHGSSVGGSNDSELSMYDDQGPVFNGDVKALLRAHFASGPSA
mmetsp:Transcript_12718/g.25146  ORF Transcript_12718/g.25146 Transcript_12718/m.25146 type:complete len:103 (+) Transcript_12718:566-874(+)